MSLERPGNNCVELKADFDSQTIAKIENGETCEFPIFKGNNPKRRRTPRPYDRMYKFYFMLWGISALEIGENRRLVETIPVLPSGTLPQKRVYDSASQVSYWLKDTGVCDGILEFETTDVQQPQIRVTKLADFTIEAAQAHEKLDADMPYSSNYPMNTIELPRLFDQSE